MDALCGKELKVVVWDGRERRGVLWVLRPALCVFFVGEVSWAFEG